MTDELVFKLSPAQAEFFTAQEHIVGYIGGIGSGKSLKTTTPVKTPLGWAPIGLIRPGDFVMGYNDTPVRVTGVFPQGVKPLVRVVFADHYSTLCCPEHLWTVFDSEWDGWRTYTAAQLREQLRYKDGDREPMYLPRLGCGFADEPMAVDDRWYRYVTDVEPEGEAECVCIKVDAPDGLFVIEHDIITHNTHVGARWAWTVAHERPGSIGLVCANTYQQLAQSTLAPLFDFMQEYSLPYCWSRRPSWYESKFPDHDGIISFPNGSQIVTRSLEKPQFLRGTEFSWVWCDETRDTKKEAWDVVIGRMRGEAPLIRITSSPSGYDWMWQLLEKDLQDNPALKASRRLVHASIYDNAKNLPPEYIALLEEQYGEDFAQQELLGRFLPLGVGLVYSTFDPKKHVLPAEQAKYDPGKPLLLSCDFNVSPMCWVIGQERIVNGLLSLVIVDEIHQKLPALGQTATVSAAKTFAARYAAHRHPVYVYGDYYGHSASSNATETDWQQVLRILRSALPLVEMRVESKDDAVDAEGGNPHVIDRVNATNAMLCNAREEVRLYVSARCKHLSNDFQQVRWREVSGKREIDKRDLQLTHMSDACTYMIRSRYRSRVAIRAGKRDARVDASIAVPPPEHSGARRRNERTSLIEELQ